MKKVLPVMCFGLAPVLSAGCSRAAKEIITFGFEADTNEALDEDVEASVICTFTEASVPYGTDVKALIATFTTSGATVTVDDTEQTSGVTPNDFTNPVIYTVKAADGSTDDHTVTVTIESAASEDAGFNTVETPGDAGTLTLSQSGETLTMVYANNQNSITFPTGTNNDVNATLIRKFFIGETEVTNGVLAAVLQWAYDRGKFSNFVGDHNEINTDTAQFGGKGLIYFNQANSSIGYDGAGTFSVESGYEDLPAVYVSWYGAVLFCNWLTEMRDGHTNNISYTGITADWDHADTIAIPERDGYRLPTKEEYEYTARYLGTAPPSTGGSLDTERIDGSNGYYWTPGNYASGAVEDYEDEAATRAVGWYKGDPDMGGSDKLMPVKQKTKNRLGLYDMSGNASEWLFTKATTDIDRLKNPGTYDQDALYLQVGVISYSAATFRSGGSGFRLCRSYNVTSPD